MALAAKGLALTQTTPVIVNDLRRQASSYRNGMYTKWAVDTDHCRSWPASDGFNGPAFTQTTPVIVNDLRWQASSYGVG